MALESCKTLALFDYRFFCVRKGILRSDGFPHYLHLDKTLGFKIDIRVDSPTVNFNCDLMPINLVKFNTETETEN